MTDKPQGKEDEYIARKEYEKLKKLEEDKNSQLASDEKKSLKELHHMRCPKCGMQLITINYKDIEVDKCSECQGVWLDAGELEAVSKLGTSSIDKLFSVFRK